MWDYLESVYHQENLARRFQLEHEIAQLCQDNISIQEYYSGLRALWTEYTNIAYAYVPNGTLLGIQKNQKVTQ